MPSMYTYEPLDRTRKELRILHLDPPETEDSRPSLLKGRIEHVSLLDNTKYDALSYVWGDPTRESDIRLSNGTLVPISKNLQQALSNTYAKQSRAVG